MVPGARMPGGLGRFLGARGMGLLHPGVLLLLVPGCTWPSSLAELALPSSSVQPAAVALVAGILHRQTLLGPQIRSGPKRRLDPAGLAARLHRTANPVRTRSPLTEHGVCLRLPIPRPVAMPHLCDNLTDNLSHPLHSCNAHEPQKHGKTGLVRQSVTAGNRGITVQMSHYAPLIYPITIVSAVSRLKSVFFFACLFLQFRPVARFEQ